MKAYDIRALESHDLPAFFSYLEQQLADNGRDGTPLFQPQPRGRQGVPEGRRDSFTKGLTLAVGEPGWRRAWLAHDGDSPVAHLDLRAHPDPHTSHRALLGMGVLRSHRRQGLATRLMEVAFNWARQGGILDYIDLCVLAGNHPARALYTAAGFSTLSETPDFFRIDGRPEGEVRMSLRLGVEQR